MKRYIVREQDKLWFVVDTKWQVVVKEYESDEIAREVAECKNWDEEQEIFTQFG